MSVDPPVPPPPPQAGTPFNGAEIYLAYTSLAIIVIAFASVLAWPGPKTAGTSPPPTNQSAPPDTVTGADSNEAVGNGAP